jgi:hypothetical protein
MNGFLFFTVVILTKNKLEKNERDDMSYSGFYLTAVTLLDLGKEFTMNAFYLTVVILP